MIKTEFKTNAYKTVCKGCNSLIEYDAPSYHIVFETEDCGVVKHNGIRLCEDCGNHLQNDMSDDYCRFDG